MESLVGFGFGILFLAGVWRLMLAKTERQKNEIWEHTRYLLMRYLVDKPPIEKRAWTMLMEINEKFHQSGKSVQDLWKFISANGMVLVDPNLHDSLYVLSYSDAPNPSDLWRVIYFSLQRKLYEARQDHLDIWVEMGSWVITFDEWDKFRHHVNGVVGSWSCDWDFDLEKLELDGTKLNEKNFDATISEYFNSVRRKFVATIFEKYSKPESLPTHEEFVELVRFIKYTGYDKCGIQLKALEELGRAVINRDLAGAGQASN